MNGTGTIHVTLTDPPSCTFPNGSFTHAYVTIRSVQAHTSATADDNSPGWQELAPQLNDSPMQVDLFSLSGACLLVTLGSNTFPPELTSRFACCSLPTMGEPGRFLRRMLAEIKDLTAWCCRTEA
jgi:hypothetical protein